MGYRYIQAFVAAALSLSTWVTTSKPAAAWQTGGTAINRSASNELGSANCTFTAQYSHVTVEERAQP